MATPAIDSLTTLPQPTHLTLLFRHHKSVVFLSVSPTQSFTSIKVLLLEALQQRGITSIAGPTSDSASTSIPLPGPDTPNDIELAVLTDKRDVSRGWSLLTPSMGSGAAGAAGTGKRKAGASKAGGAAAGGEADTPAGVGLVDGSWVAYRVKRGGKGNGEGDGDGELMSVDEKGDVVIEVDWDGDQGWDVVVPAFEEEGEEGGDGGDADEEMGNGEAS